MLRIPIPKRLSSRLILLFAFLIGLILGLYAWRNNVQENQLRLEVFKAQSDALTYQVSVSSKRFLITSDFAELENIFLAFAQYPGVEKLMLVGSDKIPVVVTEKINGQVKIDYNNTAEELDAEFSGTRVEGRKLISQRHLDLGNEHFWIYLVRDNTAFDEIRRQATISSVIWVLWFTSFSLIAVYLLIRRPMRQLHQAAGFARSLVDQQDQRLEINHGGVEVMELGQALSDAARELSLRDRRLQKQQLILDTIRSLQSRFIAYADMQHLFDRMLQSLIRLTESEYGFIGEILHDEDSRPYLKSYAMTNIAWDAESEASYEKHLVAGMEFHNLDTLFGEVIKNKRSLIANDAPQHPAARGVPLGHPPLETFLGLAIHFGDDMVGIIGLANRRPAYEETWLEDLQPLMNTCGQIIDALRNQQLRQYMEEELQESQQMLLSVLDTIPVRVFWKDPEGRYLGCNSLFAHDAQKEKASDIIGLTDYDLRWSNNADDYREQDRQVVEERIARINDEQQQMGPDGEVRWILSSKVPLTNARGEVIGVLGTYDDITARKQAQDRVQVSETRLAEAQRIAHLGNWETYFATASRPEYNHWSDEGYRIFGLEPQGQVPGFGLFKQYIHPEDRERVRLHREQMINQGEDFSYECRVLRSDGEERYIGVSAELIREGDLVIGVKGTVQDLTERRQVERLKDEFISTVSHELRTPLTSIRGSLGLVRGLAKKDELPHKVVNLLDIAHNNTERLLHLINDILDISKIESGELSLNYASIHLQDFLAQVIHNNQHYTDDVSIELIGDIGDLQVEADPERLMQIMNNLVSNACKFSPKGAKVEILAQANDNHVRISVTDNGPGIPLEYQARIFEKFTQADSSNTRNASGTGLGLSISKALVEKHGGCIGFDTRPGQGTSFYVVLPLKHDYTHV